MDGAQKAQRSEARTDSLNTVPQERHALVSAGMRGRPVDITRVGRARGFARQEPRTAPHRQDACDQQRVMSGPPIAP